MSDFWNNALVSFTAQLIVIGILLIFFNIRMDPRLPILDEEVPRPEMPKATPTPTPTPTPSWKSGTAQTKGEPPKQFGKAAVFIISPSNPSRSE
ncbi:hypothetical protein FQN49_006426 [Arthroderma sp. PD_2]|nr:hypothetical protein FQN49_006426 [Arthroderma sp. PD_2]